MPQVLADGILPTTKPLLRSALLIAGGSLLVAAAAQIIVPMWPVPMTLQTLAVLTVGATLGSRLGFAALGLYALEGAIGLPVFAGGKSGLFDAKLDYILPSSSMGYVVGFVLAAWLVGYIVESGETRTPIKTVVATFGGAISLYLPGLIWLGIWAHLTQNLDGQASASAALHWGLYPFIVGDVLKALIAGLATFTIQSTIDRAL